MTQTSATLETAHKDHVGARIGMWLFLFTEILLFGGLFLLYAVYRSKFPGDFHYCAGTLDTLMGALNTAILLTSSLTMALAVVSLEKRNRKLTATLLIITLLLGVLFLVNKYFEWSAKIGHGIYPNSEILQTHTAGENLFYGLYYLMTGLHGLHILIGLIILGVMLHKVSRWPRKAFRLTGVDLAALSVRDEQGESVWSHQEPANDRIREIEINLVYHEHADIADRLWIKMENAGLYWHLVDVIWIFLFPLFYLIS